MDDKKPAWLFWCDCETTGLNEKESSIVELSYMVTEFNYPYALSTNGVSRGTYLIRGPGRDNLINGRCSLAIQEMHSNNGLIKDLEDESKTTSLFTVESDLLAISEEWTTEKDKRVVIAGNSVGFDLRFLQQYIPAFASRLSHRVFDVSSMSTQLRSLGMSRLPKSSAPAHRALEDVESSLLQARACADWVLGGARTAETTA